MVNKIIAVDSAVMGYLRSAGLEQSGRGDHVFAMYEASARAELLRERLSSAMREASENGEDRATGTLRLLLAAISERDICARDAGLGAGIGEAEILEMIRSMVEQRRVEMSRCESGARLDLVEQEAEEIAILERFLPPPMSKTEIAEAVDDAIAECAASKLKDLGPVLSRLKTQFDGQIDLTVAKRLLHDRLG